MSRIGELIKQYCPDGVAYKYLWELSAWDKKFNAVDNHKQAHVIKYKYLLASELKEMTVPNGGTVKLLSTGSDDQGWTTEELAGDYLAEGEVVAIPWGGRAGVQYFKGKFVTTDNRIATALNQDELNNKFLYYFLLANLDEIQSFYRGSGIQHPNMAKVLDLRIPVPPIEVQREIVNILDKFTQLEAELEAELEARRKQYEYYRNELLSFKNVEGGVRWVSMSEVFDYANTRLANSDDANIPYVGVENLAKNRCGLDSIGELPLSGSAIRFEPGDVLVGNIRPYLKKIWLADCEGGTNGDVLTFRIKPRYLDKVDSRFAYQWLSSDEFFDYAVKTSKGAKMPRGDKEAMLKYRFPLVPRAIQDEVLLTLESFQKITSDLNSGLPAEIATRRKQYEYYRDQLLSFKELDVA